MKAQRPGGLDPNRRMQAYCKRSFFHTDLKIRNEVVFSLDTQGLTVTRFDDEVSLSGEVDAGESPHGAVFVHHPA